MENTCANPLLLEWIKEWLDQARDRNSKGVTVYKKAYDSMKACPLTFNHPSEAQQLNGLGPKLCDRLTARLKSYCDENGLPMPERPRRGKKRASEDEASQDEQPAKKPRKPKQYVPALRSGPYALMLGLTTIEEGTSQALTKAQLIEVAQEHCDSSFTAPSDASKFYTAWNSMKTLVQKDLVYEHGRPQRKYALTEEGWEIAKKIKKTATQSNTLTSAANKTGASTRPPSSRVSQTPDPSALQTEQARQRSQAIDESYTRILSESPEPTAIRPAATTSQHTRIQTPDSNPPDDPLRDAPSTSSVNPIALPPGSFTIELVLDVREVRTSKDRDYISNELSRKGITPHVRSLELGDAVWVAKCTDPNFLARYGEEGDEIVLDWIVERKRLDDLIGSIKDGRFHEQKFRLGRSGMKNVVYLIEEFSAAADSSGPGGMKYHDMVASAIASTQVVNGYFVKKTNNLDDSIRYLERMTRLLRKMYTPDTSNTITNRRSTPAKKLSIIPTKHLSSSQSYLSLLSRLRANDPSTTHTITFASFSGLSSKSDTLSLRDLFLKMLMCTRGVSGDKALEIQRRWPTPRAFIEAFESAGLGPSGSTAKDQMVSDKMSSLVGRRKVARALSKRIAEIWGS